MEPAKGITEEIYKERIESMVLDMKGNRDTHRNDKIILDALIELLKSIQAGNKPWETW